MATINCCEIYGRIWTALPSLSVKYLLTPAVLSAYKYRQVYHLVTNVEEFAAFLSSLNFCRFTKYFLTSKSLQEHKIFPQTILYSE